MVLYSKLWIIQCWIFNSIFHNVHLILEIWSKATDVVKIVWTLCGFNLVASLASVWPPGVSVWAVTQSYQLATKKQRFALHLGCIKCCKTTSRGRQRLKEALKLKPYKLQDFLITSLASEQICRMRWTLWKTALKFVSIVQKKWSYKMVFWY